MSESQKWEIKFDEKYGRHAVACTDLRKGELIFHENPAVVGPYWASKLCCLSCYEPSMTTCKKCKMATLCYDCDEHDQLECDFFINSTLPKNFLIDHFDILTPLRIFLLGTSDKDDDQKLYNQILKMESHSDKRINTNIWKLHNKKIVSPILSMGLFKKLNLDENSIQAICGILDVNTFEVRRKNDFTILRGLYPNSSLLAHDCIGNTLISLESNQRCRIYAATDIKAGETIFYNYTNGLKCTPERQLHLKITKYFECRCYRCMDPTEQGTYMNSIKCNKCPNGLASFYVDKNIWQCEVCQTTISRQIVDKLMENALNEINQSLDNITALKLLIRKYEKKFNSNHSIIIDAKQNMAAIYRNILMTNEVETVTIDMLEKKLSLCNDIVILLNKLYTKGELSRIKGIALYEQHSPIINLAKIRIINKEITKAEFLNSFRMAEKILKESIGILIYEDVTTPEGQLGKRAMLELKEIRNTIGQLTTFIN